MMTGLINLKYLADLEDDGRLEDELRLVVQHLEHDGSGPGLDEGQLRVRVLPNDVPILEVQEVDDLGVQPEDDVLLEVVEDLLVGGVYLVVHCYFELHALVEVAVRDYLYYYEG